MNRETARNYSKSAPAAASQTTGSYSLAETMQRKTADHAKRLRPSGTVDLSRKPTQDLPPARSFNDDLKAKIEALEQAENKTKLICPGCGATSLQVRLTCSSCGRYFERGVEETIWDKALNPLAGDKKKILSAAEQERSAQISYLGRRLLAKTVDVLIVGSILFAESALLISLIRALLGIPGAASLLINFYFIADIALAVVTVLGYQALFESSPVQATLGKLLCGLYVTNNDGHIVRSEQIVFKTIVSLLPLMAFALVYGYFYQLRLQHGLGLDVATTAVVAISAVAALVTFAAMHIMLGAQKRRQTVPDLLLGTVVRERE